MAFTAKGLERGAYLSLKKAAPVRLIRWIKDSMSSATPQAISMWSAPTRPYAAAASTAENDPRSCHQHEVGNTVLGCSCVSET